MNEQTNLFRRVAERGDRLREERDAEREVYRRLFDRPHEARARAKRPLRAVALAFAAVVAVAALIALLLSPPSPRQEETLSFIVGGAPGATMTWIDVPDAVTPIRFSDGTAVVLQPGARARVDAASPRGAEVSLEDGRAMISVVPKRDARWLFHAGDYDVRVTGTVFELAWSRADKTLFVQMHEGSVVVSGPELPAPRVLVTGESVIISARKHATQEPTSPNPAVERTPPAPAPAPSGSASSVARAASATASAPAEPSAPVSSPPSFRALSEKGELHAAFERLEPSFDEEVARSDAAGLMEIGRICRLTGHGERAATAYLAVRDRYAGSSHAANAAFDLGGLRFSSRPSEAETWFRTFLAEAGASPLASAARGRLLELAIARGGSDVRGLAEDYLAHHPDGAHAELARATLAGKRGP